jgi:hypothetical protein
MLYYLIDTVPKNQVFRKKNSYFMLKIIVTISFSLLAIESNCQNLSLLDLKYLLEHDVESADTYITSKGFQYHKAQKGENGDCDSMIWSFNRDIDNDNAQSFIAKNCYKANYGFIWYQLVDNNTFDRIKNNCKNLGYKLTKTEVDPFKDLCTTFENLKYKIQFCSGLEEETNKNSYTITLKLKNSPVR